MRRFLQLIMPVRLYWQRLKLIVMSQVTHHCELHVVVMGSFQWVGLSAFISRCLAIGLPLPSYVNKLRTMGIPLFLSPLLLLTFSLFLSCLHAQLGSNLLPPLASPTSASSVPEIIHFSMHWEVRASYHHMNNSNNIFSPTLAVYGAPVKEGFRSLVSNQHCSFFSAYVCCLSVVGDK